MKIEVLEETLRSKDRETGQNYDLEEGDRVTVSDACGERWCDNGWAKDLSGQYPTAERVVRGARVQPRTARHAARNTTPGGNDG